MSTTRVRVVVYMRDAADHHLDDARLRRTADMCARRGYQPVSVIREGPGETGGLADALRMVCDGKADRIVMASGTELPDVLESDTGSLPGRWVGAPGVRGPDRQRRTRPTRRGDAGA